MTWLKWINCNLLSRTKNGRYCDSENYSDCIAFSLCSTRKVCLNLYNLHHFDSETSHRCKPSVLAQLSVTVMSHPSKNVVISKLIKQGKSEGFESCDRPIVRKRPIWVKIGDVLVPCDLEIWRMTLKNNRAPLQCNFKLCASFRSHRWFQTGVTVRKRPIWVKIDDF